MFLELSPDERIRWVEIPKGWMDGWMDERMTGEKGFTQATHFVHVEGDGGQRGERNAELVDYQAES